MGKNNNFKSSEYALNELVIPKLYEFNNNYKYINQFLGCSKEDQGDFLVVEHFLKDNSMYSQVLNQNKELKDIVKRYIDMRTVLDANIGIDMLYVVKYKCACGIANRILYDKAGVQKYENFTVRFITDTGRDGEYARWKRARSHHLYYPNLMVISYIDVKNGEQYIDRLGIARIDDILDVIDSYIMHDDISKHIRKVKDTCRKFISINWDDLKKENKDLVIYEGGKWNVYVRGVKIR